MSTTIIPATPHLTRPLARHYLAMTTLLLCAALPAQNAIPTAVCEQLGGVADGIPALQTITEVAPSGRALPDFTRVQATAVDTEELVLLGLGLLDAEDVGVLLQEPVEEALPGRRADAVGIEADDAHGVPVS